jgi:hypothetical protein
MLEALQEDCQELEMTSTLAAVGRLIAQLKQEAGISFGELASAARDIQSRLTDDLDVRVFLAIDYRHIGFYNEWIRGWEHAIDKFPSISFDVEAASKCRALNRYTTCVFHASRIAEIGSVVIGKAVGYKDAKPSLHSVLNYLENALSVARQNYAQANLAIKGNADFYAEIVAHMHAVNQAWRQHASHMDNKYTEEEAERAFGAIKSLMQHTATRPSESDAS